MLSHGLCRRFGSTRRRSRRRRGGGGRFRVAAALLGDGSGRLACRRRHRRVGCRRLFLWRRSRCSNNGSSITVAVSGLGGLRRVGVVRRRRWRFGDLGERRRRHFDRFVVGASGGRDCCRVVLLQIAKHVVEHKIAARLLRRQEKRVREPSRNAACVSMVAVAKKLSVLHAEHRRHWSLSCRRQRRERNEKTAPYRCSTDGRARR